MCDWIDSKEGYIVFECGGTSPISCGADEKWFQTYDEAMAYAISIVNKRVESFKKLYDINEVMVYKGPETLLHQCHSIPGKEHRVIFHWKNYK